ncbi:MAG: aminoacyl-tRNA hydrolase [Dehalococcoidia bacterium]|nr:aminoacyl-tRNA hydrolase [Dehalococcoidia bacterium]MCB9491532.1 aminoacyl-tRNA hydrolase [Dehalococcoidia bacterium]
MAIGGRFAQFRKRTPRQEDDLPPAEDADLTRPLVVFGLGNPEERYEGTRHNVGAWVIAAMAKRYHAQPKREGRVNVARIEVDGHVLHIAQPRSYMNESGGPIAQEAKRLKARPEQVMIVYDELDLPVGATRMRLKGSSGGNNGIKSIIGALGSQEFPRLRIGIDRPYDHGQPVRDPDRVANWVLSKPSPGDRRILEEAVERTIDAIELAVREGYDVAMNHLNAGSRKPAAPPERDAE